MALSLLSTITTNTSSSETGTYTVSHTTDTGTTLLVVMVANGTNTTAMTFNGDAMTEFAANNNGVDPEIWYLLNPDIATANIVATCSSNADHGLIAYNFSGNDTVTPLEAASAPALNDFSEAVVTTRDGSYVIGIAGVNDTGATVAMTTGTERLDGATSNFKIWGGDQTAATAGSQTITFTASAGNGFMVVCAVRPPAAAAGPANLKTYNTNIKANIKSINTNLLANIKSLDTNT